MSESTFVRRTDRLARYQLAPRVASRTWPSRLGRGRRELGRRLSQRCKGDTKQQDHQLPVYHDQDEWKRVLTDRRRDDQRWMQSKQNCAWLQFGRMVLSLIVSRQMRQSGRSFDAGICVRTSPDVETGALSAPIASIVRSADEVKRLSHLGAPDGPISSNANATRREIPFSVRKCSHSRIWSPD